MGSLNQTTRFRFNPNSDTGFSGILEIYAHHARNIHNICIYDNQDVYAKFSLTYNPDETLSTRIVNGGGKNPEFNEHLVINVNQIDAVLKCEMWMMSRAKNFMEDQLLGFVLVPISHIVGKGKITRDFSLSSTDLFHSPAGTVKLSLCLVTNDSIHHSVVDDCSITSEVVLLDRKISEVTLEYSRIEFPDIDIVRENQLMVSEYFGLAAGGVGVGVGSFLQLGAACSGDHHQNTPADDYEMSSANSSEEENGGGGTSSPEGENIVYNGDIMSSLSLSNEEATNQQLCLRGGQSCQHDKKLRLATLAPCRFVASSFNLLPREGTDLESSSSGVGDHDQNEEPENEKRTREVSSLEEGEESSMQRQIVDMYIRSMQQFTESLAKMKLPMDLDKLEEGGGQNSRNDLERENTKKKDGNSRVFYGSRAFF